jgi:hypothetical protein
VRGSSSKSQHVRAIKEPEVRLQRYFLAALLPADNC